MRPLPGQVTDENSAHRLAKIRKRLEELGSECTDMNRAQIAPVFFQRLQSTGRASTRYESKFAVLTGQSKMHLRVTYTRRSGFDEELSRHSNWWIVVSKGGRSGGGRIEGADNGHWASADSLDCVALVNQTSRASTRRRNVV